MDKNNYVAPNGSGYQVVVNGNVVGQYPNETQAEQIYNSLSAPTPTASNGLALTAPSTSPATLNDAALQQLLQQNAQQQAGLTWSQLLGYVVNGTPPNGTLTQKSAEDVGTIDGQPTLANLLQQANLTGVIPTGMTGAGGPTYDAQNATGFIDGKPTVAQETLAGVLANGSPTLEAQQDQATNALDILKTIGSLTGPANAFQQQNVLHGLDAAGLSNAVDAINGALTLPKFSAPNAQPQALNLSSLLGQIANATSGGGGSSWSGAPSTGGSGSSSTGASTSGAASANATPVLNPADGGQTVYGGTHIYMNGGSSGPDTSGDDYNAALPALNKINAPAWQQLDPDTQAFLTSAYENQGYSANDVANAVKNGLPQFKAPAANPGFGAGGGVGAIPTSL